MLRHLNKGGEMKYFVLVAILSLMLSVSACGSPSPVGDSVEITITDDGLKVVGTDVEISNYYKGARTEVKYLIKNESAIPVEPLIYVRYNVNPEDYSKGDGFKSVPRYYIDWLDIPKCGPIESGGAKSYVVVLNIPEDSMEDIPDKWAFKVGVDPQAGFISNTVAVWWRVDMR